MTARIVLHSIISIVLHRYLVSILVDVYNLGINLLDEISILGSIASGDGIVSLSHEILQRSGHLRSVEADLLSVRISLAQIAL